MVSSVVFLVPNTKSVLSVFSKWLLDKREGKLKDVGVQEASSASESFESSFPTCLLQLLIIRVAIHPIYACCFSVIINSASFHSQKCPNLDGNLYSHSTYNTVIMRLWSLNPRESWLCSGRLPKPPYGQKPPTFELLRGKHTVQWEVAALDPALEACASQWTGMNVPEWVCRSRSMQNTVEMEQKLVAATLHSQPLSPGAKNTAFSKKIRLFTSIMSFSPAHSCSLPPIDITCDFIMSTWFQVEGCWVCLILNLEQKNKGVGKKQK